MGRRNYFGRVVTRKALDGLTMKELLMALDRVLIELRRRGIVITPTYTCVGQTLPPQPIVTAPQVRVTG